MGGIITVDVPRPAGERWTTLLAAAGAVVHVDPGGLSGWAELHGERARVEFEIPHADPEPYIAWAGIEEPEAGQHRERAKAINEGRLIFHLPDGRVPGILHKLSLSLFASGATCLLVPPAFLVDVVALVGLPPGVDVEAWLPAEDRGDQFQIEDRTQGGGAARNARGTFGSGGTVLRFETGPCWDDRQQSLSQYVLFETLRDRDWRRGEVKALIERTLARMEGIGGRTWVRWGDLVSV